MPKNMAESNRQGKYVPLVEFNSRPNVTTTLYIERGKTRRRRDDIRVISNLGLVGYWGPNAGNKIITMN